MQVRTDRLTAEDIRDWEENRARRLAVAARRRPRRRMLWLLRAGLYALLVACLVHGGLWVLAALAVSWLLHGVSLHSRRSTTPGGQPWTPPTSTTSTASSTRSGTSAP